MKPIVQLIYNGTGSLIDLSLKGKEFQNVIEKELKNKRYEKIVSSPIQLYITLVLNPSKDDLIDSYQQNGSVYVKVAPSLHGDSNIYSLQLGLSRLQSPDGVDNILVIINDTDKTTKQEGEDAYSDEIKYVAIDPESNLEDIILPEKVLHKLMRATKIIKNRDVILNTLGYAKVDKNIKSITCWRN